MKYRIIIYALILSLGTFVMSSLSYAQKQDSSRSPHSGLRPQKDFMEKLKKDLNLTDDQTIKIQKIFDDQHQEMAQMNDSTKTDRKAMREKMEQQRKQTNEKISALLTDEQKVKFEEMQKQQAKHFGRKHKSTE